MVETLAKSSSKKASAKEIISQVLASGLLSRNQKAHGTKGASTTRHIEHDCSEDLAGISDAEVVGYLNNKKEFLLKKILWEQMNRDYKKGRKRKDATKKKKTAPANKTDPTKKTMINANTSCAKNELKKRLSPQIDYDALEKLFESEESPKRAKLEKPEAVSHLKEDSEQAKCEESLSESQNFDEGTDINEFGNDNCCAGDMHGDGGYYGVDLQDQDEGEEYDNYYNNFGDE
ncbi:PREDICTED: uncharacterized protein LOC104812896 [Tarenaya hassleriana]|uniref:uncharacterized protein LOC104812896 n=1 Tax=Tarenaya hassleriana TaxID=28532 RepID=UPI00053CA41B|nr:PREDICTED: uncharacterized protein LOC104812896 [Tarenaya hassleriana]